MKYETFSSSDEAFDEVLSSDRCSHPVFRSIENACDEIADGDGAWCQYDECPTMTALVNQMDAARTVRELAEIGRKIAAHASEPCQYRDIFREGIAPELASYQGATCVHCASTRRTVVTERMLSHRAATVCCHEAA